METDLKESNRINEIPKTLKLLSGKPKQVAERLEIKATLSDNSTPLKFNR